MSQKVSLKAVDFFCGGGGMTYGFRQAGIEVIAGIDIEKKCRATYKANNKPAKFIRADIKKLTAKSLAKKIGIEKDDDNLVFIGCSPCQYWSILKTDKTKAAQSKNLLEDFQRFVDYFNPGFVVIENVPGIFSKKDSPLKGFINFLETKGYFSKAQNIVKVCDYGVPQSRKRFVLIASRVRNVAFPTAEKDETLTVRKFIGNKALFPEVTAGHRDKTKFCHTVAGLSEISLQRFKLTKPDGGTREAWKDTDLQVEVYRKKDGNDNFAFQDVYGRMFWDKPAPTITTKFFGISHGRFGHPEQDRAISIREGATLQTFPPNYFFKIEAIAEKAKIIGNAVPPEFARRIAHAIVDAHKG